MESFDASEFLVRLMQISDELETRDLNTLKFLCRDFVSSTALEEVSSALDIFDKLESRRLLSANNPQLLLECLFEAQRRDLMKILNCTAEQIQELRVKHGSKIKPYRLMLHHLNENMIQSDVKSLKFHLKQMIPRKTLEEAPDAYSLFLLMERQDLLGSDNLEPLLQALNKLEETDLITIVNDFKDKHSPVQTVQTHDTEVQCGPSLDSFITIPEYPIKSNPKGYCLIINNENFPNSATLKSRAGSQKDVQSLKEVFTHLQFDVHSRSDLTSENMFNLLKSFAKRDHSQFDCFVCCILSHGDIEKIYGTDGKMLAITDIVRVFSSTRAKTLNGKPKIFFLQACQGSAVDTVSTEDRDSLMESIPYRPISPQQPIQLVPPQTYLATQPQTPQTPQTMLYAAMARHQQDSSAAMPHSAQGFVYPSGRPRRPIELGTAAVETDNPTYGGGAQASPGVTYASKMLPREADFLIGLATIPGFASFRSPKRGSWYIEALCECLRKFHNKLDLQQILNMVNNEVSKKNAPATGPNVNKQIPTPANTLRRSVYFRTK